MDQDTTNEQTVPPVAQQAQAADSSNDAHDSSGNTVSEHKLFAILGYILPFLFFIPLLQENAKHNAFARFHANQQLILLVVCVCAYVLQHFLYVLFFGIAYAIMSIINLIILVLAILGIVNAVQGKMKELPVVGQYDLLKYFSK